MVEDTLLLANEKPNEKIENYNQREEIIFQEVGDVCCHQISQKSEKDRRLQNVIN